MDDSKRTAVYRRRKSGGWEDVRMGSPLQKGHLVYWHHWEFHLRNQQRMLDEGIQQLMAPCFRGWTFQAFQGERGLARAVQDAEN